MCPQRFQTGWSYNEERRGLLERRGNLKRERVQAFLFVEARLALDRVQKRRKKEEKKKNAAQKWEEGEKRGEK